MTCPAHVWYNTAMQTIQSPQRSVDVSGLPDEAVRAIETYVMSVNGLGATSKRKQTQTGAGKASTMDAVNEYSFGSAYFLFAPGNHSVWISPLRPKYCTHWPVIWTK